MYATKEMMDQIALTGGMTLDELSEQYKGTKDPRLLATAYVKLFGTIVTVANKYNNITADEKGSIALQSLDATLLNYDGSVKFHTYYYSVLRNRFRTETSLLSTQKRRVIFMQSSYDEAVENGFDIAMEPVYDEITDIIKTFTKREQDYCNLLMADYSNNEISGLLGVSVMTLCNLRKGLREKLAFII